MNPYVKYIFLTILFEIFSFLFYLDQHYHTRNEFIIFERWFRKKQERIESTSCLNTNRLTVQRPTFIRNRMMYNFPLEIE